MTKKNSKIAVCITCHNYGKYLERAVKSVIDQSYKNWEIFLFLDACTDNSEEIAKKFKSENKIKIFVNKKKKGLVRCANTALKLTSAKYFTRLDADDFLHKKAYELIINEFNQDKTISLVYTDYYYTDEFGNIIDVNFNINKKKQDNPAHGACSVFLREKFYKYGGYNKLFKAQDGYDLWISFLQKNFKIKNLDIPLFFYRQHSSSMSKNLGKILNERSKIQRFYVKKKIEKQKIAYIIGGSDRNNFLLKKLNSKPLLQYSIDTLKKVSRREDIYISSNNPKILKFSIKNKINIINRPKYLEKYFITVNEIIMHAKKYISENFKKKYDIFVFINSFNPFLSKKYIIQGLDHLRLFNCDNVIAAYEDFDLHYSETENGLTKILHKNHSQLRIDRQAIFVDSRMYRIMWDRIINKKLLDKSISQNIGKIIIPRPIALNIRSRYDFWTCENIINSKFLKKL